MTNSMTDEGIPELDVAIIGAGPAGLSTALSMSQGRTVAVFERAHSFRPIGAALGLFESGYAALSALKPSIADKIKSKAANPKYQVLQRPTGEIMYNGESLFHKTPFTWLGWYTLQCALKESLPDDVKIHLSHRLIDMKEERDFVELKFQIDDDAQPVSVRTRVLIGADGGRSIVRQHTVSDGPPTYTGTMTWRGVVRKSEFDASAFGSPFQEKEENGCLAIIGDRKNFWVMDCGDGQIAWTGTALQEQSEQSDSALDTAKAVFEGWPPVAQAIMSATEPTAVVESGIFDRDPVESWGVSNDGTYERSTLLGDAAHPMRPALGLGATNAFEDALTLSTKLLGVDLNDSSSVAKALAEYEAERIASTTPLQILARKRGEASHDEDQAEQFLMMLQSGVAARRAQAHESG